MDRKISELTSATSVAGVDIVPLVQSGATKKVSASTLFANIPVQPVCKESSEVLGSGVISPTILTTIIDSASNSNLSFTLANTTHGQVKEIVVSAIAATFSATIAVTGGKGFSTITMDAAGESVYLKNINGNWYVISYRGATIS